MRVNTVAGAIAVVAIRPYRPCRNSAGRLTTSPYGAGGAVEVSRMAEAQESALIGSFDLFSYPLRVAVAAPLQRNQG